MKWIVMSKELRSLLGIREYGEGLDPVQLEVDLAEKFKAAYRVKCRIYQNQYQGGKFKFYLGRRKNCIIRQIQRAML